MSSGELYGADSEKKVTVRVPQDLADAYDERCDDLGISRSEAIRRHIRSAVERQEDATEQRQPPTEDDLARAYNALLKATGPAGGYLRDERAKRSIAQQLGVDTQTAWGYIRRLRDRGYVGLSTDSTMRFTGVKVRV